MKPNVCLMSYLSGSPINLSPLAFSTQYIIPLIMAKRKKGGSLIDSGSESDDYDSEDTRTIFFFKAIHQGISK